MDKQELDGVRQLLEIALNNLTDQAAEGKAGADATLSGGPLVVILAGGSREPGGAGIVPAALNVAPSGEKADRLPDCGCDRTEKKHSHPGLERFTIEADSHPSVPKTCFMEPGRACVNSGACEMRGF